MGGYKLPWKNHQLLCNCTGHAASLPGFFGVFAVPLHRVEYAAPAARHTEADVWSVRCAIGREPLGAPTTSKWCATPEREGLPGGSRGPICRRAWAVTGARRSP